MRVDAVGQEVVFGPVEPRAHAECVDGADEYIARTFRRAGNRLADIALVMGPDVVHLARGRGEVHDQIAIAKEFPALDSVPNAPTRTSIPSRRSKAPLMDVLTTATGRTSG